MTDEEGEFPPTAATRHFFTTDGLTLSYLDYGRGSENSDGSDERPVLLALHGHLNEARFVDQGAVPLDQGYRVIALDQRGHGLSDHASSYATERYVDDALALLDQLRIERVTVLGHSLGGAVAYLMAARAPSRVTAMVIVDIGAEVDGDLSFVPGWPRRAATAENLIDAMGFMGPNQAYVIRHYPDGWGAPWDAHDMNTSQRELNGDHWAQWLATSVPTLLIHGTDSNQLSTDQADQMARRRPGTAVVHLQAGHAVYVNNPIEYRAAVSDFLTAVLPGQPQRLNGHSGPA